MVTANSYSSDVDLRLNDGDGTLRRAGEYPVGGGPASVAVADLNNDGRLDIVTTNGGIAHGEGEEIPGSNTISVLIQQADGWARSDYPAGKVPMGIAIADVNADKIPDLVTVNRHESQLALLLGKDDGTFRRYTPIPIAGLTLARRLAAGDVNGDGAVDIIIPDESGNVIVVAGKGDGTFMSAVSYPTGGIEPVAVAVGDLNGDGNQDVVTANGYPAYDASVLLGSSEGRLGPPALVTTGFAPHSVVIADVNGDGSPDIVTGNVGGNTISLLAARGDGSFEKNHDLPTGSKDGNNAIAVADMNGDGQPDVVTSNYKPTSLVTVLLQTGS